MQTTRCGKRFALSFFIIFSFIFLCFLSFFFYFCLSFALFISLSSFLPFFTSSFLPSFFPSFPSSVSFHPFTVLACFFCLSRSSYPYFIFLSSFLCHSFFLCFFSLLLFISPIIQHGAVEIPSLHKPGESHTAAISRQAWIFQAAVCNSVHLYDSVSWIYHPFILSGIFIVS